MDLELGNQRLLALAEHLESGELGHKHFTLDVWNSLYGNRQICLDHSCGTYGCAVGELPILFPEDWKFSYNGVPELVNLDKSNAYGNKRNPYDDARVFFALQRNSYTEPNPDENAEPFNPVHYLFDPDWYRKYKDAPLSKERVAKRIRKFVEERRKNHEPRETRKIS